MAKNPKQVCLSDEDSELFEIAKEKYKMGNSELLNEIIHSWLFSNKLQLQNQK